MAAEVLSSCDFVIAEVESFEGGGAHGLEHWDFILLEVDLLEEEQHPALAEKDCVFDLVFGSVES